MSTTLLGVWAHPDDEAYLSAGLMAAARRRGDRVVVVTATSGQLGTSDPERWPPTRLGALRRHELRASLAALGVHEHHVLGYHDGHCAAEDAAGPLQIAAIMDDIRPDLVVTFGPDGMTGHPDHRAVSRWTTEAWRARGGLGRLWYATVTSSFHAEWGQLNDELGLWAFGRPPCHEADELAHIEELDDAALDQKLAALRAHASQTTPLIARVGEETYRAWWRVEAFVDAARGASSSSGVGELVAART
jgi:LmbE family N-acetylglucosaminyl deacetylase